MAVYNGAAYLIPQVQSIISQLRESDELIVVDDCSEDNSFELLMQFSNAQLRVFRHERNVGVLASFENALRLARGDILFLSDQDDVWMPDKVDKITEIFLAKPEVSMVTTDAQIIDESGTIVSSSFFSRRGQFKPGVVHNIIKNKYLGCTLAFRRGMLDHFLPIPADTPMHDIWFGLLNGIYGQTHYIDQPLISYRRHSGNVSPSIGAPVLRKMVWRWRLIKNLIVRVTGIPGKVRRA